MKLYGLSAYNNDSQLIKETNYIIPNIHLATVAAKIFKKFSSAHAVEIHLGTKKDGFYGYVKEV